MPNYYNDKIRPVECLIQNKNCLFNSEEDYKNRSISDFNRKIIEIKKNSVNKNILYFDPYKILCPSKICYVYNVKNKILIYRDGNHLTIEGSLLLKKQFNKFLKKNLEIFLKIVMELHIKYHGIALIMSIILKILDAETLDIVKFLIFIIIL